MAVFCYKSPRRRQNGFTLVEVLIAMAVLSITVLPLISLYSMSLRNVNSSRLQTTAAFHAQAQMDIAIVAPRPLTPLQLAVIPNTIYSFSRTVDTFAGMTRVRIAVTWRDRNQDRSLEVVSLIAP